MAGKRQGIRRSMVAASVITGGAVAAVILPAIGAGAGAAAAPKTVLIGNGTTVVVPKGWSAGKPSGGKIEITHNSPNAVMAIEAGTGVTASPMTQGQATFKSFIQGFGLKSLKVMGSQNTSRPGEGKFNEAWSESYTGKHQGQLFGGLVAEFQNTTTGDACFAVVIAKQSDKPKLKNAVNQMFDSVANN